MSGRRLLFILVLIGIFMLGVWLVQVVLRSNTNGGGNIGEPGTIRGVVSTLLPSGKVIVVKKDDGSEVLVSLSGASAITSEAGEAIFYQDVEVGMPISAAGIRGDKDNVLIPSLVTVKTAYAHNGKMVAKAPLLHYEYFSLHYSPKDWDVGAAPNELRHAAIPGCKFAAGATDAETRSSWKSLTLERKIGGNVFKDTRYTENGNPVYRTIVLEDAGLKYGLANSGLFGSYIFRVSYDEPMPDAVLTACLRAVDQVLGTFVLRNASERILVTEPQSPIRVGGSERVTVSGMARPSDNSIEIVVVDENERILWRTSAVVNVSEGRAFGSFRVSGGPFIGIAKAVQLRVFQYSLSDGNPTDTVKLPMEIQS
ncbi:MAG: hypothetical protein HYT40_01075 [Candidatus Sungbacteria bacterium]|uniref:Bacterial spore germination immunoglobulin-like domain-containing protein n=1 Tax=Candidatus Sungiibacteriota bacterium TaxID=2750080 RepID=A0A931SDK2_9BACT|nr:hypothetical protein [Candidatus Sungbacteria bacterium]